MNLALENTGIFILVTIAVIVWNLLVVLFISKKIYQFFDTRYDDIPADYISRKAIHVLAGGVTAVLIPIVFINRLEVAVMIAFLMAAFVFYRRNRKGMYWFQRSDNAFEVNFCLVYGFMILLGWVLGDIWLGLIPILFMTFGDGATGIVRAIRQKQQIKTWDGTIGMFVVCAVIGFVILGWVGIVIAAVVSLVEKVSWFDDNISVPFAAAFLVFLFSTLGA